MVSKTEANTGSIRPDTDDEDEESVDVMKLVRQAMMQTVVSVRIFLRLSEKIAR